MKKGFTLIELLAVIVILAIIALIATPIVLNIINDAKESATLRSADFYVGALENEIMLENMKQGGSFNPKECKINEIDKKMYCDGKEITLKVDGEIPTSGSITFEEGKVTGVNLTYPNGYVTLNNKGELVLGESQEVELAPGLYDKNDKLLASWDELVDEYDIKNIIEYNDMDNREAYIESDVLSNYANASKLVIDESVTSIGAYAFSGCNLEQVIIPEGVKFIGFGAFSYSNITSITIPDSVTIIGEEAFDGCTNLTSITIPDSVTEIGGVAFQGCTSLTSITIPDSVTIIWEGAFQGCTSLTEVTIGNRVTTIVQYLFSDCTSLTTINYTGTEAQWNAIFKDEEWDAGTPSNKVINYNYAG